MAYLLEFIALGINACEFFAIFWSDLVQTFATEGVLDQNSLHAESEAAQDPKTLAGEWLVHHIAQARWRVAVGF